MHTGMKGSSTSTIFETAEVMCYWPLHRSIVLLFSLLFAGSALCAPGMEAPPSVDDDPLPAAFEVFARALQRAEDTVRDSPAYGSDRERAAGYLHISRMLMKAVEQEMLQDPDYPFFRVMDLHIREGGDNPDQRYLFAPVRGAKAYRIHGQLGSADRLEVQLYAGEPWAGNGRSAGYLGFEQIEVDEAGRFAIDLRPPGAVDGPGQLENPADTTTVVVRQIYADWSVSAPGHVHIDRLGLEGQLRLPESSVEVAARLHEAARVLEQSVTVWPAFVEDRYRAVRPPNTLSDPLDTSRLGGVHGRWMASGHFDVPPGKALLVRSWPTSAHYQGLQLTDRWFASLEYANGTASLSSRQSLLAPDGSYYHVISAEDPGYANWLGTGGLEKGTLLMRFDGVQGDLPQAHWPSASLVAVDQLPELIPGFEHLEAGQREQQIRERRAHVQRRFSR